MAGPVERAASGGLQGNPHGAPRRVSRPFGRILQENGIVTRSEHRPNHKLFGDLDLTAKQETRSVRQIRGRHLYVEAAKHCRAKIVSGDEFSINAAAPGHRPMGAMDGQGGRRPTRRCTTGAIRHADDGVEANPGRAHSPHNPGGRCPCHGRPCSRAPLTFVFLLSRSWAGRKSGIVTLGNFPFVHRCFNRPP